MLFSHWTVSHSLWPFRQQHIRLSCPWLSPGGCSDSCPLNQWCYLTISSSAAPFSFWRKGLLSCPWLSRCCCSITKSCPTLCDPMDCGTPGFPVLHYLSEFAQTHIHWVDDAIQSSHPLLPPSPTLSPPSPPAVNLSWYQGLFKWVSPSYQVVKVLEFQLQHQSFQWIFRIDFL